MIVFVHCGNSPLPSYVDDTLAIARRVAPKSRIVLLAGDSQRERVDAAGIDFVALENVPPGPATARFRAQSPLDRSFRDGFWYFATERFLVLADFMRHSGAEDVVHLENDVALYFDPADKLDAFRAFADFAVPLDRIRAIASVVWCRNSGAADRLAEHLLVQGPRNDMESVGSFCIGNPDIARPLPTLPAAYARERGLDPGRYCQGLDAFGGIFDAAAIGQYVGGVHRLNDPHDSRFFINESSDLDLRHFDLAWNVERGVRSLSLECAGERVGVLALHAHSKDVAGISPFNHGVPADADQIVTGERIQALADLTVGAVPITQFHGAENIKSKRRIEIPQNEAGQLLVPDQGLIDACDKGEILFVYTHLLLYFKRYILPRLTRPFVLLAHNSDHGVGLDDLDLLNHPLLERCWAQNCETAHTRLSPLPIGMANRQWGATKSAQLAETGRHIEKRGLLYVNVNPTHPSRAQALAVASQLPGATVESGVEYGHFISQLACHKFCLCPRGNGLDSHRFWEAQYLDCIPIIIKADWTSAYSELPVLLLNSWDELPQVDLQREYVRIKGSVFRYESLFLGDVERRITDRRQERRR